MAAAFTIQIPIAGDMTYLTSKTPTMVNGLILDERKPEKPSELRTVNFLTLWFGKV